jgi:hypothetical protein
MLYMAGHYAGSMDEGLLDNANCGGENVHRGAVLGALWGAHNGSEAASSRFAAQLHDKEALAVEIDAFVDAVLGSPGGGDGDRGANL